MANFDPIKDQIIPIEGDYVWDHDDLGGETKYGISKRSYPDLDIKKLTLDDACAIYKRDFWDVMRLSEVNDQKIAENIFWFGVNSGTIESIKILQHILNEDKYSILNEDGICGTKTLQSLISFISQNGIFERGINSIICKILLNSLKLEQISYYVNIVKNKPSQNKFLLGWINRTLRN
jgi:lysozyme family protein